MLRLLLFVVLGLVAPWSAQENRSLQNPHDFARLQSNDRTSAIARTNRHPQDDRAAVVADQSPESIAHVTAEHDTSTPVLIARVIFVQPTRALSVPLEQHDLAPVDPVLPQSLKPPRRS